MISWESSFYVSEPNQIYIIHFHLLSLMFINIHHTWVPSLMYTSIYMFRCLSLVWVILSPQVASLMRKGQLKVRSDESYILVLFYDIKLTTLWKGWNENNKKENIVSLRIDEVFILNFVYKGMRIDIFWRNTKV